MINAAGIFFYCDNTNRYLYLLRSDTKNWSIPGGKLDQDETLLEGLIRECEEEIGYFPENSKLIPIHKFTNGNFCYNTFFCRVDEEFKPILNNEHCGWSWVNSGQYPKPIHNGLYNTINADLVCNKLDMLTNVK